MVSSDATSVEQYLAELPDDRRVTVETVRDTINAHLPEGVTETMRWGMIAWEIPLAVSGPTENGQPVGVAALASQKQKVSLYMTSIYADPDASARFEAAWKEQVGRIDRGKSCVRFKGLDDCALDVIADAFDEIDLDQLHGQADAPGG